jgi:hypothetical protein
MQALEYLVSNTLERNVFSFGSCRLTRPLRRNVSFISKIKIHVVSKLQAEVGESDSINNIPSLREGANLRVLVAEVCLLNSMKSKTVVN